MNPLHNIVHIGVGALWLAPASRHAAAKSTNTFIGVVYALVTVLGFLGILDFLNIKDASSADNFLHLASAAAALFFATAGAGDDHAGTRTA